MIRSSETCGLLSAALSTVQAEVHGVAKNAQGHGYKYAPLDEVTKLVNSKLAAAGLSYVQMPGEGTLITRLMHSSGEWLEASMTLAVPQLARGNDAQAYGAALTYARRYALTAMLGIVADEDTDAATWPVTAPQRKPQPMQTAPAAEPAGDSNLATPKQCNMIRMRLKQRMGDAYTDKDARALLVMRTNKNRPEDLTKGEASKFIDWLGGDDVEAEIGQMLAVVAA